jgi:hypothetical protein
MREDMIDLKPGKDRGGKPHLIGRPDDPPLAMVAAGGMEGVIREARLFLEKTNNPVFVLRTTAGAAGNLASHLQGNLVQDKTPLKASGWQNRVSVLEKLFPVRTREIHDERTANLPLAPYAVLMQKMVLQIAKDLK